MKLLILHSSLRTDDSASRKLTSAFLDGLQGGLPVASVTERDLAAQQVPHLPAELVPVQLGLAEGHGPAAVLADELIGELEAADLIVVGMPMYNFTVPSTIKAWIDHVVRANRTFSYTAEGPVGLLAPGKKVVALVASGGGYAEGPTKQIDFLEPYFRWLMTFIGITDVTFVRAEYQGDAAQATTLSEEAIAKARALGQQVSLAA